MSYILDALKKVEREKTRKAASGGMTRISGDLFLERMPRPSRGGVWKIIAAIVLVSLVTFAATWFALNGDKKKGHVASRSTVSTAVPPLPIQPVQSSQPLQPASTPPPPTSAPSPPPQQTPASQPPAAAPAAPPVISQPVVTVSDDVRRTSRRGNKLQKAPKPLTVPVQTIPAPADIKVSGIAWQEERAARRVVINGFLLQEGATISGAKITDIHQERVRFTSAAGTFEVRMDGAATLPGAPK